MLFYSSVQIFCMPYIIVLAQIAIQYIGKVLNNDDCLLELELPALAPQRHTLPTAPHPAIILSVQK